MLFRTVIPRGVIDIDWRSMLRAWLGCLDPRSGSPLEWAGPGIASERCGMLSLSVRTAFDALLTAMAWPPGSEILTSAITIPDMLRIINQHGLVAVPLDVPCETLAPKAEQVVRHITPRTRAVLVAHLFGAHASLGAIGAVCRHNHLPLWEDAAQSFPTGLSFADPAADVSFFSFGKIKTQTAAGGALVLFRDHNLAKAAKEVEQAFPQQTRLAYAGALADLAILKLMGCRTAFAATAFVCRAFDADLETILNFSSQGFAGRDLFTRLRRRPAASLAKLLRHRLSAGRGACLAWKQALAEEYSRTLPSECLVGAAAAFPTRWVYPIRCHAPHQLVAALRAAGYDATARASRLMVVPTPAQHPSARASQSEAWLPTTVYLPLHPALGPTHQQEIASVVRNLRQQVDVAVCAS